ncbi:hypothetical protein [Streptomyces sp. NPDC053367]|uniref:hypothetical protein n=1 Tax=Streptomyces sp. NPDC053367 TaxID=3365700 RepID=UPI0037D1AC6C
MNDDGGGRPAERRTDPMDRVDPAGLVHQADPEDRGNRVSGAEMEAEAGMGERLDGGTTPDPAAARPGHGEGTAALEEYLAVALRRVEPGSEGERRALAAYRAARQSGARRARTRRRDDWRPREARAGRPLRTTLAVLLAGLTLGGVAYAAVGGTDDSPEDTGGRPAAPAGGVPSDGTPSGTAPSAGAAPGDRPGTPATGSGPSGGPPTAEDTDEARCRAYAEVEGRGEALEATAWERLVKAAGGEKRVDAYCAARTRATKAPAPAAEPALPDVAVPSDGAVPSDVVPPAPVDPPTVLDPPAETGRPDVAAPTGPVEDKKPR